MVRVRPLLRSPLLCCVVLAAAAVVAGCSMDPPTAVTPVVHNANVQTSAPRAQLERWEKMVPPAAANEASGLTPAVVIRDPADLGELASTLPKDFDFGTSMLLYLGKEQSLKRRMDSVTTVVLVEADARDAFSPGVSVTPGAMSSVVGITFGVDPCCRGPEPADGSCRTDFEAKASEYASTHLVLFAAPRIDHGVQVMVQHTPCSAP